MFEELPRFCYSIESSTGATILIKKGEKGYFLTSNQESPQRLNAILGISPAQAEAMLVGSSFGWNVPGADPNTYKSFARCKDVLEDGSRLTKDKEYLLLGSSGQSVYIEDDNGEIEFFPIYAFDLFAK